MDQPWTAYADAPGAARPRDTTSNGPSRLNATPGDGTGNDIGNGTGNGISNGSGDGDGDVAMEDADPYKPKYSAGAQRPIAAQRPSQPSYLQQHEDSAAARRYSPMNLSPTSPYAAYSSFTPQAQAQSHAQPPNSRQSPTRTNPYMSPPASYYSPPASRPHAPQLPPIQSNMGPDSFYPQSATAQLNAVYSREGRSPRTATNPQPPQLPAIGQGPVPKFEKCANTAELQPKINAQPPFRRANPEGGFISVSLGYTLLTRACADQITPAPAGADRPSTHHIQALQWRLQLPILAQPAPRPH